MPSKIPTRPSSGSSPGSVIRAHQELTPMQKKVFFAIGATLAFLVLLRYLVQDIIRTHEHTSAIVTTTEYGGSIALLVIAIGFMLPPFGMWMIAHLPLPGFLKRKSE